MLNPISTFLETQLLSAEAGAGRRAGAVVLRAGACSLTVLIAIVFPQFERMLGLVGGLCSYTVCSVFPAACYLRLFSGDGGASGRSGNHRANQGQNSSHRPSVPIPVAWAILLVSVVLAVMGTVWPFLVALPA